MRVGKLRSLGSHPVVGRPAILLLFAWFVSGYLDWQPTGGWRDDAGVRLRYVDRELLLLKAGENENGLVRWLTGADNPAETCQLLRLSLPETAGDMESWYLPIVHQVLVRYEAEGLGKKPPPINWPERVTPEGILTDPSSPWFVAAAALSEVSDSVFEEKMREAEQEVLNRALWGNGVYFGLIALGLILLVPVLRRKAPQSESRRLFRSWSPWVILTVFVVSEYLSDWGYSVGSTLLHHLGVWSYAPWIWLGFLWRAGSTILLCAYFFGTPNLLFRSFRIFERPNWRASFVAIGVVELLAWPFYYIDRLSGIDPNDYFSTAYPTLMDLVETFTSSVIAAPIFEEIVFRGFLFLGLRARWGAMPAALISTVLFSIIHIQYGVLGMLSVGLFGLSACWLVHRTNSLASAIFVHALTNAYFMWSAWWIYQDSLS